MAANQNIIEIERRISEAISAPALEAFNLGCIGIHIGFSPSGGSLVECFFPVVDRGEVDKPTFAKLMNDAARSIVAAKKMLASTSLSDNSFSDNDWGAYGNLIDQVYALIKWVNYDREDEEGRPVDFVLGTTKE